MLISQSNCKSETPHGSLVMSLAELRQELAAGKGISSTARQRLRSLTRRLAKVQALGDEYNRVTLSDQVQEITSVDALDDVHSPSESQILEHASGE